MMLILALFSHFSVSSATMPDAQTLLQQLGIQQQDVTNLNQGQIVFFNVAETTEKELAAGAAMYLPVVPSKIMRFIKNNGLISIDTAVTAKGAIPPQATLAAFNGFSFQPGSNEAANFLAATPGSQFNLSTQEFQTIQAANSAQPGAASQLYQAILLQRWQAYRQNGLNGIAPYDRGDGTEANPGGELQTATQNNSVLASYFPELYNAWLNYPSALPAGAEERFFWLNHQVQSRPTAILGHRAMLSTSNGEVILSRQFYAGHSYNSNQLTIACLPYLNGSLVFYANKTFTDQVAGFGSSFKHSIGDEQERSEMTKILNSLSNALQ
jgi:hypothetical protein